MVVPNKVHASRKRPLLVRYGPIMMSVCMPRRVGWFMKDALRRACMLAATSNFVRQNTTVEINKLTERITLVTGFDGSLMIPLSTIALELTHLQARRKGDEDERKHVGSCLRVMLSVSEKAFDFLYRCLIWCMRERAGLRPMLEVIKISEELLLFGQDLQELNAGGAVWNDWEWISWIANGVHILSFGNGVGERLSAHLEVCELMSIVTVVLKIASDM